ncbi:MAG: hypothetical protein KKE35_03135 [Actinobacteria bacterium]|nr:hypothetical protein [Actinomycetota bacterium]
MTSWINEKVKNRKFSIEFLIPLLKGLTFIFIFVVIQVFFYFLVLRKIIKIEDLFTLNITLPNLLQLLPSLGFILVEFFAYLILIFLHKLKLWMLDCIIKLLGSIKIKNTSYQDRLKRLKALFKKRDHELNNTITAINYFGKLDSNDKLQIYNMLDVLDKVGLDAIYSLKTDKFTFEKCYNNLLYSCKNSKFLYISGIAQYEFIGKYLKQVDPLIKKNNNNMYREESILNILQINPKIDIKIMLLNPVV